jgi:ATP-dependent RNA helicase SUPV3L1/SUV3
MPPVLALPQGAAPLGYRRLAGQALRIDMAEKLLRESHDRRGGNMHKTFWLDPALATSMGLAPAGHVQLLRLGGFSSAAAPALPEGAFGPATPAAWRWRPPRRQAAPAPTPRVRNAGAAAPASAPAAAPATGAFAALAGLVRPG